MSEIRKISAADGPIRRAEVRRSVESEAAAGALALKDASDRHSADMLDHGEVAARRASFHRPGSRAGRTMVAAWGDEDLRATRCAASRRPCSFWADSTAAAGAVGFPMGRMR